MASGDAPLECIGIEKIGSKPKSKNFYPFAYALLDSTKESHCWNCLAEEVAQTCDSCDVAKFCSKECEKAGNLDHKYECKALKKCPDLSVEERMLIRIVGRHKDITNGNDKNIPDFYKNRESERKVMEIWEHCSEMKNDEHAMKIFNNIYNNIVQACEPEYLMDKETVFQLHCRNYINRHSISNRDYLKEIAKGLYLDLCRYDHSCRPNAIYSCDGIVSTLRALHDNVDIDNIQTTHYTYIELPPCKIQRKHMLRETWYFDCHCERCDDPVDNWLTSVICPKCLVSRNTKKTLKIHGQEAYANIETMAIVCNDCNSTLEREYVFAALEGMRMIRQILDTSPEITSDPTELIKIYQGALINYENILPMSNSYFCQLIAAMIPLVQRASMTRKEKCIASLDLHAKCEPFVRYVYRYAHPSKAMHFFQMGQLSLELGQGKEAARYLIEAHRIMEYLFGPNHFLASQTKFYMDNAMSRLLAFQKHFVNVINKIPGVEERVQEMVMTEEEKKALQPAKKNKKNKKKKNKNVQKSVEKSDLDDLPELIADL
ncbi:unnamed protein product [Caenorhabditis bovis]|uniref:MYND-type domain-containing protein n=1 Tax=Caenorhabditis bovis TaxID=2654633 RepID=A0A8S1F9A5_9PELO|nr:unnamed protein product [Caenorhabditis bovis]